MNSMYAILFEIIIENYSSIMTKDSFCPPVYDPWLNLKTKLNNRQNLRTECTWVHVHLKW